MRLLLLLLAVSATIFAGDIEEQEAFIPSNPGMSEFFYTLDGVKHVTRIDKSVDSLWTPTEEQIAHYLMVDFVGVFGVEITGPVGVFMVMTSPNFGESPVSWTKGGNRWVVSLQNYIYMDTARYVDLDAAVMIEVNDESVVTEVRPIERTW